MKRLIFIFTILHQFNSFCQVKTYPARDEIKLLHSSTISDCSCEGIFNAIEFNNINWLDSCINIGADFECTLEHQEWFSFGLFNQAKGHHTYRIRPYDYAKMKSNSEVLNLLDVHKIWSSDTYEKILDSIYHSMSNIRYTCQPPKLLDDLFEYIGERVLFTDLDQNLDNCPTAFYTHDRPIEIISASLKFNIPAAYKYFYERHDNNKDDNKFIKYFSGNLIINNCKYPTIEYLEFFQEINVITEENLKNIRDKEFNSYFHPSMNDKSIKLLSKYYTYFFIRKSSVAENEIKKLDKKMMKIETKLAEMNDINRIECK